jgi:integrase
MSIEKRSSAAGDRFLVRWREDGKQRARTFTRRGDALVWETEVRRRQQLGPLAVQQLTSKGPTLDDWIVERYMPEHGVSLEKSTRRQYAEVYELYVQPRLGHMPLRDVTVSELRAWQAGVLAAGKSADRVSKCRTMLSSVLRHAAESEAIAANPLGLVRPPKAEHRDAVKPLAPVTVEALRQVLLNPMDSHVPECTRHGVRVSGYVIADQRSAATRLQDATIVSLLAYSGLRPGELRALRWGDIRENTILVERSLDDDGESKGTKTKARRAVRLLAPLAGDLREYRMAVGRPTDDVLVLNNAGEPWTRGDWQNWRAVHWRQACRRVGIKVAPRPYDLRHSFASLLLAEGRTVHYVAAQLGHSPTLTLTVYGHLFAEFEDSVRIDAAAEIEAARKTSRVLKVHNAAV